MVLRKHFALFVFSYLFYVCCLSGTVAQDVIAPRPRLSSNNEGAIGLLKLSETKTALEESILDWKQGMEEAADEIVHTLNDKHKQPLDLEEKGKVRSKKFDLEELEFEKSAVFQAIMYSLQLRVGRNYLPFSFLTKVSSSLFFFSSFAPFHSVNDLYFFR
jgi:hypothetical protein